ncbi:MAG: hypothetical protein B6U88_02085 [Candidatus Aenigmarchaeota archaeon ex4484_56]|nr:MAG: hypothetical protein B6U88_02085 [Candidatus Aenigmarchaeota archaeon ex4484_56]
MCEETRNEAEKWLKKIENLEIHSKNKKGEEFKKNIESYISDSKYFLSKNDFVKSFEAVIWAWAFLEIGEDIKILEINNK